MAKPITPQEMTAYVEATWNKCKKEAWQEQEPVEYKEECWACGCEECVCAERTSKREWVGLTDKEVFLISEYPECCQVSIRNAEAKLKEKNGG